MAAARRSSANCTIAELNDKTTLNQLLSRPPDNPLECWNANYRAHATGSYPLDKLIDRASARRQEIIAARSGAQ